MGTSQVNREVARAPRDNDGARAPRDSDGTIGPTRPSVRIGRFLDVLWIVLWCAIVLAPTVDGFVRDDEVRGPAPEMRLPARKPVLQNTLASISAYPTAYEAWYGDRLGLRDYFLGANSWVKYHAFRTSPGPMQVVGQDGWIFYAGDLSVETYRGLFPWPPGVLARWAEELETRRKALEAAGARYVFVIVPNKETIYPERMPAGATRLAPSRLDPFYEYMKAHTSVDFLDLRPALLAGKSADTGPMDAVYSPHGTHWTGRGTMIVHDTITSWIESRFPGTRALKSSDFEYKPVPFGADTFAVGMYLAGILTQPDRYPVRIGGWRHQVLERRESPPRWRRSTTAGEGLLPHTLIFHDSFGPFVYDQLSDSFSVLDTSEGEYIPARVDAGKTKLVVEMFVERYLVNHAPRVGADERVGSLSSQFEAMRTSIYTLDPTPSGFEVVGGAAVECRKLGDAPVVQISRQTAKEGLVTPPFVVPEKGEVIAHVVVESPEVASLEIMWRATADEPRFNRDRRVIAGLSAGHNSLALKLPIRGGETRLMLRPTEPNVKLTIVSFELRSTDLR